MNKRPTADPVDAALLLALTTAPDATTVALSEQTGLARNTVRARQTRYEQDQTLRSFERRIDPAFLGYPLSAFVVTTVKQRRLAEVGEALRAIPEVLEVQGLSGVADLLIQVVARDADDLYRIAGAILNIDGVKRTTTGLVMRDLVPYRVAPLVERVAASARR
ncbi:AsnC family transcriptional regulator [Subtercola boreus]|uniref:AsnC family transcriptional regulator n=1 Tax=Subtercola boreus TaxID=120213 RepID=A0A3E0VFX9_9MICO|nr:Lrp/AsnC family transcriptional regulator [Subtercola boreus]RFA08844.1 AsnC family transcriptional regulator [Subtercola boreus]TQL54183.1 AsnC family transcriptional regulator [Subtercola boreus]